MDFFFFYLILSIIIAFIAITILIQAFKTLTVGMEFFTFIFIFFSNTMSKKPWIVPQRLFRIQHMHCSYTE